MDLSVEHHTSCCTIFINVNEPRLAALNTELERNGCNFTLSNFISDSTTYLLNLSLFAYNELTQLKVAPESMIEPIGIISDIASLIYTIIQSNRLINIITRQRIDHKKYRRAISFKEYNKLTIPHRLSLLKNNIKLRLPIIFNLLDAYIQTNLVVDHDNTAFDIFLSDATRFDSDSAVTDKVTSVA